jgi:adenosylcobinamide hydrolase
MSIQPFRQGGTQYCSLVWPGVTVDLINNEYLLLKSPFPLITVSSALWGGGMERGTHFINWRVPLSYRCEDPVQLMAEQIKKWGYPLKETIGFQTAAKLTHGAIAEEEGDQYRLFCCVTAGTTNCARAGKRRKTFSAYECHTINIFLLIDGHLTPSAMVNGIITATEAKTAALQDLGIKDEEGDIATGTTTDAIVLGVSQNPMFARPHLFAGGATTIGNGIGRLVYETVYTAVSTQGED